MRATLLIFWAGWSGVINVSTLSKLRRLVLRDGVSIREASNRLGISRNTAKKWLDQPEMVEPRYPKRASGPGILGPFEEVLAQWLKSDSPPRPSW